MTTRNCSDRLQNRQPFDDQLYAFIDHKILCALFVHNSSLKKDPWLKETANRVRECLEFLYDEYAILPAPILLILATTKHLMITHPSLRLREGLRSKRTRRKHIKALNEALKVLNTYGPFPGPFEEGFESRMRCYLEFVKDKISAIETRKETDVPMRFCAQTLRDFFQAILNDNLYEQLARS
jgi:hypothetical protein